MRSIRCVIVLYVLFCSCSNEKKVDISIDSLIMDIHTDVFHGIGPDISFENLRSIAGDPIDYMDVSGGYDECEHSPVYYYDCGRIVCHWSGREDEEIGMVEYIPFTERQIRLESLLDNSTFEYALNKKAAIIRVYCDNVLFYRINVNRVRVTRIEYWLAKRALFNVAY